MAIDECMRIRVLLRKDPTGGMGSGLYVVIMLLFPIFSTLLQSCAAQMSSITTDTEGLLAFKAAADSGGVLSSSWNDSTNPCGDTTGTKPWLGIQCNSRGRVNFVNLNNLQLSGTFAENTLSRLDRLRFLGVSHNFFTGSLPDDLSNLRGLMQLWAQNANLSGPLPKFLTTPKRSSLQIVNLSGNNHTGPIPDMSGVSSLTSLNLRSNSLTGKIPAFPPKLLNLDLSSNFLTGNIPPLFPSTLRNLSLSGNQLTGAIPFNLAQKFPSSSFTGNQGLCGLPLSSACPSPAPSPGINVNPPLTARPNPSSKDPPDISSSAADAQHHSSKKLSSRTIVIIVVADTLVLLLIALGLLTYFRRRSSSGTNEKYISFDKKNADAAAAGSSEFESSKLVFVDEESPNKFDLDFLLRASAEMLGKGSFGTAYRAVLESGAVVTVKRLRDVKHMGKEEFEQKMELLGRLKHPNVVQLMAYSSYTKEENLLVYNFMSGGSLFSLLHGNRGPGRKLLDWDSRLQVAHGVAVGLTYLHHECRTQQIPHGNIKSSNILLGNNFEVCIADFGLVPLMIPAMAAQRMAGYRAPEYKHTNTISQKADVYSFGVLLLELLTGRQPAQSYQADGIDLPKWVQSMVREEWTGEVFDVELRASTEGEDEMVTLLQVAMTCVISNPDQRPKMAQVTKRIEDIRMEEEFSVDSPTLTVVSEGSDHGGSSDHGGGRDAPSNL